jgi:hypothetical protein
VDYERGVDSRRPRRFCRTAARVRPFAAAPLPPSCRRGWPDPSPQVRGSDGQRIARHSACDLGKHGLLRASASPLDIAVIGAGPNCRIAGDAYAGSNPAPTCPRRPPRCHPLVGDIPGPGRIRLRRPIGADRASAASSTVIIQSGCGAVARRSGFGGRRDTGGSGGRPSVRPAPITRSGRCAGRPRAFLTETRGSPGRSSGSGPISFRGNVARASTRRRNGTSASSSARRADTRSPG